MIIASSRDSLTNEQLGHIMHTPIGLLVLGPYEEIQVADYVEVDVGRQVVTGDDDVQVMCGDSIRRSEADGGATRQVFKVRDSRFSHHQG